ncbi:hypothetical protein B0T44_15255 [Nocardia donostiensis]|uniref:Uncharacterized protein n=1 Tax=Nocardia donostiensis TaxID=1538463 RepID=A0A1V2TJM4_9NOCA|nr:hypothetical protein B0T46_06965 [Nocardia donostiensis]OQS19266.1 hypothetical protein B0T44_15255 [Nocardia donostiensis]
MGVVNGGPPGESAEDRCQRYRDHLLIPAVVVSGSERIVVRPLPAWLGVVVMPERLSAQVIERLASSWHRGPVIAHPRSNRMSFLTGPLTGYEHGIERKLLSLNTGVGASCVVLPSPMDERTGFRRWVSQPCCGYLPPMPAVLRTLVEVAR